MTRRERCHDVGEDLLLQKLVLLDNHEHTTIVH